MEDRNNMETKPKGNFLNIRCYKFVSLDHLEEHRQLLAEIGQLLSVTGTIILSNEGINIALSGDKSSVEQMFEACKAIPGLKNLKGKTSYSEKIGFETLRVKIKSEIIKMNQPQIRPEEERAPFVDASTLAKWILDGYDDAGKPIKIVDTRNEFEFQLGHFKDSINLKLEKFSEFPQKIKEQGTFLKGYKLVNVCTGGIRCEKATLFMIENGISDVVQLDGGILNYLENTNGNAWEGQCFLFDEREFSSP